MGLVPVVGVMILISEGVAWRSEFGSVPRGFEVGDSDGAGEDSVVAVRGGTGVESFAYPFVGIVWVKEIPLCHLDMSIMMFWDVIGMQLGYRTSAGKVKVSVRRRTLERMFGAFVPRYKGFESKCGEA